jgi:hypothetical protein
LKFTPLYFSNSAGFDLELIPSLGIEQLMGKAFKANGLFTIFLIDRLLLSDCKDD